MLLKEVKISNLLSFPYIEHIENAHSISFFSNGSFNGMRILIGNNASGKTNFITILEEFFSTLIHEFSYEKNNTINNETISQLKNITTKLYPNTNYSNKKAQIEIVLKLSKGDLENINFIHQNRERLNKLINKYSTLTIQFPQINFNQLKEKQNELVFNADFDEKSQSFTIKTEKFSAEENFILKYIQYQKLIQILITIFNEKEKKPEEKNRFFLKKTFAIINNQRENFHFKSFIDPYNLINDINYTKKNIPGYATTIEKLRNTINKHLAVNDRQNIKIKEIVEKSDFFFGLSSMIEKFLQKKLVVDYVNKSLNIGLTDHTKRIMYFEELSSGEKSLLMIIFAIYGNDLSDGFLIINEPELHLHPQLQKELNITFEENSEQFGTQIIISTNSSLFINENNITNVYRVFKNNEGNSEIISPKINVDYDDATLIHMLKFENVSKFFFVNKIILVEGETDAYFFNFYLNHLKKQPEWKEKLKDYEILNINGKGSLHVRIRFLNKFNITNYFIGDRDNTVDYGFFTKAELNKFYFLANKTIKPQKQKYSDYYNRLVKTILTFSPKKYKAIIKGIEKLYEKNIFILKEGAIETYVSVEKKGLRQIAYFCNNEFDNWLKNDNFKSQKKELLDIMYYIFK